MNEMITVTTKTEKICTIMLARIHNALANQPLPTKDLACTSNFNEVKGQYKQYKSIMERINTLKNLPKLDPTIQKDKPTTVKKSTSLQQNGDIKSKDKIKIAALESAIDCMDPNSQKNPVEIKKFFQSGQMFEKFYRIIDMKQAAMNAYVILQEYYETQKAQNQNWKSRLEQPLKHLVIQNQTLKEKKQKLQETQNRIISILNSITSDTVLIFEKNLKLVQPHFHEPLSKIKRNLQTLKNKNLNEVSTNYDNLNRNGQNSNNVITKKVPISNSQEKLQNTNPQSHYEKGNIIVKNYKDIRQQQIQQSSHIKQKNVKNEFTLKDLLQARQSLQLEEDNIKKHQNELFTRCQQSIEGFLQNQSKLKSEINFLRQSLSKKKQEKQIIVEPSKGQNVSYEQSDMVKELTLKIQTLVNELAIIKGQLRIVEDQKILLTNQIQSLQSIHTENKFIKVQYEEQKKLKNQIIETLRKQNLQIYTKIKDLQIQLLKNQNLQPKKQEQLPIEQPQKIQYFNGQSWISASEDTKHAGDLLIKEVQKANGKQILDSTLLYRYSPTNKLVWTHFVNKPNILFIIKIATNKLIAIYSLAPIHKPNSTNEGMSEEKAFIFQSSLNGTNIGVYPLLPGKKLNGSYSTNIAFGKSDLRFSIGDTILQGNFGYAGSSFDSKKKKITELLGGAGKVNMLTYQIYSLNFNQQKQTITSQQKTIVLESKVTTKLQNVMHREKSFNKIEINQINLAHIRQVDELKQYISKQTEQISLKQKQMIDLKQRYQSIKRQQFIKNQECNFLKREIKALQIKTEDKQQSTYITDKTQNRSLINQQWMHLSIELDTIKKTVLPQKQAAIIEAKTDVANLKTEIDDLKQNNMQLTSKLIQKELQQKQVQNHQEKHVGKDLLECNYLSLKQTISNPKHKLNDSTLHSYQQYQQMAKIHQIEPLFIARIDKFFQNSLLQGRLNYKIRIIKHLERMKGMNFCKAKLIYEYDPFGSNQFHKYIDGTPNILCVVETKEGMLLAAYYSGVYTQKQIMSKPSLLICINKDQSYELYKQGSNGQRIFRGMVFDPYFLLFGNAELKIKPKEKYVFSNFGIANSFFNPRGKKTKDFFGESPKINESEFKSLQIYQIFFEQLKEKKMLS